MAAEAKALVDPKKELTKAAEDPAEFKPAWIFKKIFAPAQKVTVLGKKWAFRLIKSPSGGYTGVGDLVITDPKTAEAFQKPEVRQQHVVLAGMTRVRA